MDGFGISAPPNVVVELLEKKLFNTCTVDIQAHYRLSRSQSLAENCHLGWVKQTVVGEGPLVNESLPLWPAFFPFFGRPSGPCFHFAVLTSLQVTLDRASEVGFLFRSANP